MLTFLKWIFNSFYDVLRDVMILGGVGAAGPRSPVWIGLVLRWTLLSKQRMSSSGDTCDLINLYDFKQTKFIPVILEKSTLLSTSKKKVPRIITKELYLTRSRRHFCLALFITISSILWCFLIILDTVADARWRDFPPTALFTWRGLLRCPPQGGQEHPYHHRTQRVASFMLIDVIFFF